MQVSGQIDIHIGICEKIYSLDTHTLIQIDNRIPLTLLRYCEALAFITIIKTGLFFVAGSMGGGCIISKVRDETCDRGWRWSAPSSVGVGGISGGFVLGNEKVSVHCDISISFNLYLRACISF